jgi:hypothetical protein
VLDNGASTERLIDRRRRCGDEGARGLKLVGCCMLGADAIKGWGRGGEEGGGGLEVEPETHFVPENLISLLMNFQSSAGFRLFR